MPKRKTHEETAAEWSKRHRGNTTLGSDTATMIIGSTNETPTRKGQLLNGGHHGHINRSLMGSLNAHFVMLWFGKRKRKGPEDRTGHRCSVYAVNKAE
ncbi:hypothetical protein DY000_02007442 [Brassica cretica]|uniref:Uncharacterized protein n=1 Tax=Brassica cretica TaxID=69181 RepID=A0ABQ7CJY2_BRACR|nr:hypothetical protein DY000_02007442 [Brassica cretica]